MFNTEDLMLISWEVGDAYKYTNLKDKEFLSHCCYGYYSLTEVLQTLQAIVAMVSIVSRFCPSWSCWTLAWLVLNSVLFSYTGLFSFGWQSIYLTVNLEEKRWIHAFPKSICAKENVTNLNEIQTELTNFSL